MVEKERANRTWVWWHPHGPACSFIHLHPLRSFLSHLVRGQPCSCGRSPLFTLRLVSLPHRARLTMVHLVLLRERNEVRSAGQANHEWRERTYGPVTSPMEPSCLTALSVLLLGWYNWLTPAIGLVWTRLAFDWFWLVELTDTCRFDWFLLTPSLWLVLLAPWLVLLADGYWYWIDWHLPLTGYLLCRCSRG